MINPEGMGSSTLISCLVHVNQLTARGVTFIFSFSLPLPYFSVILKLITMSSSSHLIFNERINIVKEVK